MLFRHAEVAHHARGVDRRHAEVADVLPSNARERAPEPPCFGVADNVRRHAPQKVSYVVLSGIHVDHYSR